VKNGMGYSETPWQVFPKRRKLLVKASFTGDGFQLVSADSDIFQFPVRKNREFLDGASVNLVLFPFSFQGLLVGPKNMVQIHGGQGYIIKNSHFIYSLKIQEVVV